MVPLSLSVRGSRMTTLNCPVYSRTMLEAGKRNPSKECCAPAAVSEDLGVQEMLRDMLRRASVSEEHRALMVTVVEKVVSAKSGLNEAFTSLLRGFEVCDVMLPIE